jgi:hypothetical protein
MAFVAVRGDDAHSFGDIALAGVAELDQQFGDRAGSRAHRSPSGRAACPHAGTEPADDRLPLAVRRLNLSGVPVEQRQLQAGRRVVAPAAVAISSADRLAVG